MQDFMNQFIVVIYAVGIAFFLVIFLYKVAPKWVKQPCMFCIGFWLGLALALWRLPELTLSLDGAFSVAICGVLSAVLSYIASYFVRHF